MVPNDLELVTIVEHVNVAVVLSVRVALVLTIDLDGLIDCITGPVHGHTLGHVSDPEVLLILAAVQFDQRRAISTIEAGMLARAELIEFVHDVVKILTECVEYNSELSLLLLHVHEKAPERRDQVIPAIVKKLGVHSSLLFDTCLFSHLSWVNIILFSSFSFLFFFLLLGHGAVFSDAKLLAGTLRQSQSLEHLFELVLEFGAWASGSRKLALKLRAHLLDSRVFRAILKCDYRMDNVKIVCVCHDIVSCFALR